MRARSLFSSASFGPDALKAITQAFDEAWSELAPTVSQRPAATEAAKLKLANIILSLGSEDTRDPEPLKREAVRQFRSQRSRAN